VANPGQDSEPPRQVASVTPPQDLYPTSDIRFVLVELGKIGTKLDRLIEDVGRHSDRIGHIDRTVDRVRTGAIVAVFILSGVIALFWWAIGDRITAAVRTGLFPTENNMHAPSPRQPGSQQ